MSRSSSAEPELGSRLVLVTGGSRGIGRGIVERLADRGYRVLFTYCASDVASNELVETLRAKGASVAAERRDLSNAEEVDAFVAGLASKEIVPWGIVCNAGASLDALAALTDFEGARRLFQLNFFATAQLVKAFAQPMARRRGGRVVLIGSVASERGNRGNSMYAATKGALQSYMRCLVDEYARRGVTVNCVRPGFIATDLVGHLTGVPGRLEARIPANRLGTSMDVAAVVDFLLSESAAYVNGATIDVDGGLSSTMGAA